MRKDIVWLILVLRKVSILFELCIPLTLKRIEIKKLLSGDFLPSIARPMLNKAISRNCLSNKKPGLSTRFYRLENKINGRHIRAVKIQRRKQSAQLTAGRDLPPRRDKMCFGWWAQLGYMEVKSILWWTCRWGVPGDGWCWEGNQPAWNSHLVWKKDGDIRKFGDMGWRRRWKLVR